MDSPDATASHVRWRNPRAGHLALFSETPLPINGASTTASCSLVEGAGGLIGEVNPSGTITISEVPLKGGKPSYTLKWS